MPKRQSQAQVALRESAELVSESWLLTMDSAVVIWLRLSQLATFDPAALAESERMVSEKARAALELSLQAATGGFGLTPSTIARGSLAYCRAQVAGNRRRLTQRS